MSFFYIMKRYYSDIRTISNPGAGLLVYSLLIFSLFGCDSTKSDPTTESNSPDINNEIIYIQKQIPIRLLTNYNIPLKKLIDSLNMNTSDLHIEVDKSKYKLTIWSGRSIIKQYPVVFGRNPTDDKLRQGDHCTPEGSFKVLMKYKHRIWSKFIWIDYPNAESIEKINKAKRAGIIPWDANPGSEIGIHGVPGNNDNMFDYRENWTLGCISLKNNDINEIYEIVKKDTRVIINK